MTDDERLCDEGIRLGPIQWAVVTKYLMPSGLFVRLEDSGEKAFMDMVSVDDHSVCCNPEYWPGVGERIRVRRLGVWPGGEVRVSRRLFTDRPVNPSPPPGFFACRDNRASKSAVAYTQALSEAVVERVRAVGGRRFGAGLGPGGRTHQRQPPELGGGRRLHDHLRVAAVHATA